jgi:2-polyprenyl-3-methyl-5-hydroxy-6-metoxy-1,4-benzoquinol methylase
MNYHRLMNKLKEIFPFENYIKENSGGDAYQTVFSIATKYLPEKSNVLDFGSGPCDKTAVVALLGHNCIAYDDMQDEWHKESDNSRKILEFSKKIGVQLINTLESSISSQDVVFDMIMLNDVIEHLHESPKDILLSLLDLLKDDGVLFITVPNAGNIKKRLSLLMGGTNLPSFESYYWYPGLWRGHIREYVHNDLIELSNFLDLEVELIYGCDHMLENVPTWLLPLYKFVTRFFPKWKDSWVLVARKKPNWSPLLTQEN